MIPKLCLAPIRGITDAVFRNAFSKHFGGFDVAVAPFIATQKGRRVKPSVLKDVLPERNSGMPVVPQLLSKDPDAFVIFANALFDLGYETINWNLGCPFPMVANKQRGSGLLPFPDKIEAFLDKTLSVIPNTLSVKIRLGRNDVNEVFHLMPIFNQYPLTEIIIHPRTGKQMYDGKTDLETFEKCLPLSAHPVVYNGDITDLEIFRTLCGRFKKINCWMIGRGALYNPFLPGAIKKDAEIPEDTCPESRTPDTTKYQAMKRFHDELLNEYSLLLSGPSHLLRRMKGFWKYLALPYENSGKIRKKIFKTNKIGRYEELVACFFDVRNDKDSI